MHSHQFFWKNKNYLQIFVTFGLELFVIDLDLNIFKINIGLSITNYI